MEKNCCALIEEFLIDERVPFVYIPKFREYGLILLFTNHVMQQVYYCPWCGTKLPSDLRDQYFAILEKEYGIKDDIRAQEIGILPEEFKNDEWWKKRKL